MPTRPLCFVTLVLAVASSSACASIAYRSTRIEAPPRSFDAVAVYPFALDFDHRYHQAYGKTDNLLRALRERIGDIPIIGPEEFEVIAPDAPPREGSTLLVDARARGFVPERVAVLRARAQRQEHVQRIRLQAWHGLPPGYVQAWWADYRVTVELVTIDGVVLARTVAEACEQRGDRAAAPAQEPYPKLRDAIPLLVHALYSASAPVMRVPRRPVRTDIEVLDVHRRLFRHPDVALALAGEGTVERDVAEIVHYSYFHDAMPASWLPWLRQAKEGVVVLKVRGAALKSGLHPGDVITAADGSPVQGPASFARALARGARTLTVLRGSTPVALALAPPCSRSSTAGALATAAPAGGTRIAARPLVVGSNRGAW